MSKITQKHFVALATVVAKYKPDMSDASHNALVAQLCATLKEFNPRFRPDLFKQACASPPQEVK